MSISRIQLKHTIPLDGEDKDSTIREYIRELINDKERLLTLITENVLGNTDSHGMRLCTSLMSCTVEEVYGVDGVLMQDGIIRGILSIGRSSKHARADELTHIARLNMYHREYDKILALYNDKEKTIDIVSL